MTKAEEIYHRFVNYEWNEIGEGMKVSIIKAIDEALKEGQKLPIHSVVFNEAENCTKCLKPKRTKPNTIQMLCECDNSEVELPNRCKSCGRTDEERLTMTSMCGVSACPY